VWISEIMLQQTRVAVVIDYWKRWMEKWPTVQDLAAADPEQVLSAWRGLGYYSRATRIHQAAKLVVDDPVMQGLLPADARELKSVVPGVGPYTAGAISAIVFGHPEAMVDGNVVRVLSRQMGVLADFKSNKAATDLVWRAAGALAKSVSSVQSSEGYDTADLLTSDRPGRWGQALMELGSTVCTPKPDCSKCPITSTCRAFAEGMMSISVSNEISQHWPPRSSMGTQDIEDLCSMCQPIAHVPVGHASTGQPLSRTPATVRKARNTAKSSCLEPAASPNFQELDQDTWATVAEYARNFPAKGAKKAVRVQESVVCAIRCGNSYLIQKRASKGLLAGLWELPSYDIPEGRKSTASSRKGMAQAFVSELLKHTLGASPAQSVKSRHVGELGSVPWLFSHIQLTMHVHLFELPRQAKTSALPKLNGRWVTDDEIGTESTMGTGMFKCWKMVKADSHS
jgi:A/G-specific adenine glycosylase